MTLKWLLNIVRERGNAANWKNPKHPNANKRNKYVPKEGEKISDYFPNEPTIGTMEKAKAVGIAVFRQTKGCLLSLMIE